MKSLQHSELRTVSLCGMSSEIDTETYKIVRFIGQIKESEIRILYTMYSILIFLKFTSGYTISRKINENRGAFYDETGRFNGRITTEGSDQD